MTTPAGLTELLSELPQFRSSSDQSQPFQDTIVPLVLERTTNPTPSLTSIQRPLLELNWVTETSSA